MNQLYVYIYFPPAGLSSPPPTPHPTPLGHRRAPSPSPCSVQQVPASCLLHSWQCTYVRSNLPVHPIHLPLPYPPVHSLPLRLYSCPANRFICAIFLESTFNECLLKADFSIEVTDFILILITELSERSLALRERSICWLVFSSLSNTERNEWLEDLRWGGNGKALRYL